MSLPRLTFLAVLFLAFSGCGLDPAQLLRAGRPTPPPLGVLQARRYTIEVYAGPVFSVIEGGQVLADLASAGQLQASLPDVYREVQHLCAASLAPGPNGAPQMLMLAD